MSLNDPYPDEYELYEEEFNLLHTDRQARRKRKTKIHPMPRRTQAQVVAGLTDEIDSELDGGFQTTYQPSRYEAAWLLQSLRPFYDQALIADVLGLVKGGKEANVYRCRAHPSTGVDLLAAKVYRPRMFRSLSNDAIYAEGRTILEENGHEVKATDERIIRALRKRTGFGQRVAHTSWVMHEFTTLQRMYEQGGAVPRPFASAENAILMGYHGDADVAAPTLHEVSLERAEAEALFDEVLGNVELLLAQGWIHGDLSAYNILYWEGEITIIDFPQVVSSRGNNRARSILERDITRLCGYFAGQGANRNPTRIVKELWRRYAAIPAKDRLADLSARFDQAED